MEKTENNSRVGYNFYQMIIADVNINKPEPATRKLDHPQRPLYYCPKHQFVSFFIK